MVSECEDSFLEHAATRRAFRTAWKAGQVVGPLELTDGVWVAIWDGFNPWPNPERKSVEPAVNDIETDAV